MLFKMVKNLIMKKGVFSYLDKYCYGELCQNGDDGFKPKNKIETFLYSKSNKTLYFNGNILVEVSSMFNLDSEEFRNFFKEWFVDRYKLPVIHIF